MFAKLYGTDDDQILVVKNPVCGINLTRALDDDYRKEITLSFSDDAERNDAFDSITDAKAHAIFEDVYAKFEPDDGEPDTDVDDEYDDDDDDTGPAMSCFATRS